MAVWLERKSRGWWAAVGVITAVMMIAAGCGHTSSAQPKPPGSTVNVSATRPAILHVGSAAVSLPAGAVAGHGKLAGRTVAPPSGPPDGTTFASPVYDFEVGGTVLTGQANLTLPVAAATPAGAAGAPDVAVLVYWDATQRAWTPLTTATYDKATQTVAGPSRHLSIWAVLRVNATSILAAVGRALLSYVGVSDIAAQPKCPGADQVAASGVNVVSDKGSIVEWCAGVSAGSLQLIIANNREYALEADYPAAWTMQRIDPPGPIFDQAVASLSQMLTQPIPGDTPVIIPGGQSIRITVPIGAAGEVRTRPTPGAYLLDALIYGADTLAMTFGDLPGVKANPSLTAKAISLAFTVEGCSRTFDALAHNDISSASAVVALFRTATDLAVGCLADQWKAAYGLVGQASTFYIGVLLWLRDGLRLVMQGLEAALETGIYWRSYRIAVYSTGARAGAPSETFYGDWHVHGSTAHFSSDGTGWEKSHAGFTADNRWVDEVDSFALSLAADGGTLTVTITSIKFVTYDSASNPVDIPNPNPGADGNRVDDIYALRFDKPNLIKTAPVHTSGGGGIGNPYLCGAQLAAQYQNLCGA